MNFLIDNLDFELQKKPSLAIIQIKDAKKKLVFSNLDIRPIEDTTKPKIIAYIDGGNLAFVDTGIQRLDLLRVAYSIWQGKKHIETKSQTIQALVQEDKIIFSDDTNSKAPKNMALEDRANYARQTREYKLALDLLEDKNIDVIAIDGSVELSQKKPGLLKDLLEKGKEKNIQIIGLSKTNSFSTDTGAPLSYILKDHMREKSYINLYSEKNYEISMVKFHKDSPYTLKLDSNQPLTNIYSQLSLNSNDALFLGYPYGFVKVDEYARVTKQEIIQEKNALPKNIQKLIAHNELHEKLDTKKF